MAVNSYMFRAFMLDRIMSKMDRGLVITKKVTSLRLVILKSSKTNKPCYFRCSGGKGIIFFLRGKVGNGSLLLGLPANGGITKNKNIRNNGVS